MINWNVTSPLQEYCFGAACDLWDTTTVLFCSVHEDLLENTSTKIKVFAPFPSGIQGQNETDGWMDGRRGRWQHYLTRTRRVSIYNKYTPIKTANLHRKDYLNTTCVWFASALVYCSLYLIALVIRCFWQGLLAWNVIDGDLLRLVVSVTFPRGLVGDVANLLIVCGTHDISLVSEIRGNYFQLRFSTPNSAGGA